MYRFLSDVRYALRSLRRAPVFALAAVLALGIGTGSAAAVFSLLDGVVLTPLPYADPDRLVSIWEVNRQKHLDHEQLSPVNFGDYRSLTDVFADAAAWWQPQVNLVDDTGEPIRVETVEVSQNFFEVLGVAPVEGRGFSNADRLFGGPPEIVISARLFRSRFGGDRRVLGQTVALNGSDFAIVGVMPDGFSFPARTDVWQGLSWDLAQHSRGAHFMEAVARLKPGVTPAAADAALRVVTARLGEQFVATNEVWGARVIPLRHDVAGVFRPALIALFGASGLLLLIACINVANLLLARATAREREVAVRTALGASRGRLIRLFLTESAVLAAVGSVLGLGFAFATLKVLLAWTPVYIPRSEGAGVNLTVVAFSVIVATIAALAFGLAPALLMSGTSASRISDGARGSGRGGRSRGALVVAETALAVMLLAGSGLLIRSVSHLLSESTGVDPVSVVTANVQLPDRQYGDWGRVAGFYGSLTEALRTHPEIPDAGVTSFLPLDAAWRMPLRAFESASAGTREEDLIQHQAVDSGYFAAMHIRIVAGRAFDARDVGTGAGVVIVNETLARRLWPGQDPIGKRIVTDARQVGPLGRRIVAGADHEVIGVASDVKNSSIRSAPEPAAYFAQAQFPFRKMNVVIRMRGEPARVAAILRAELRQLDPALPTPEIRTMERVLGAASDTPRFVMFVMSAFGVLALLLAAVGIYGILNYAVNRRRREFAIRLALGADRTRVLGHVLGEGVSLAAVGCGLGVMATLAGGRLLQEMLYQVQPSDVVTLSAVLGLVLSVAVIACLVPAWRAARQDPALALREE